MRKVLYLLVCLAGILPAVAYGQSSANIIVGQGEASDPNRKELLIPNAFTPNGDGRNDIFQISNFSNEKLIDFRIFNRWGTILFRSTDPKNGWDGTYKGQEQPMGVYGYLICIGYPDGKVETYKGTVTLLR
ncbi:gliding motility-associated C-terminal domain-containing protein [Taibaiella chishuiensis]|uniref:gliding motility-associated C-terminal domain-containing protein n=1 Tax=Taibaiella chishuiensis TaxID=1434707 RepID=UPI0015E7BFF7|nr:gliding motility-associated C-terminal domain-containing protein [Taibaiella chishuiensis]